MHDPRYNPVVAHTLSYFLMFPQSILEFHHLEPSEKDFSLGHKGYCIAWEKVKLELDKCVLLCSNCHREVHAGLIEI